MADADPRIPPDPRNRVSHYGSQPISSVRGLEGQLNKKQDADPNLEVLAAHVVPQTGQMYIPAYVHPLNSEDGPQLQWKRIGPNPKDIADNQTAASLNPIAIGSGSTTFTVATRTALAQAKTSLASLTLTETGREGLFVWDGSNLSARVTADPNQGVYVAPSSAPSGASGSWVRKFSGYHNVRWFGAVGDDVTNDGPAFLAALAYLKAIRITSSGFIYNEGTSTLFIPLGKYYLAANTLDITVGIRILGEALGDAGGEATQIRWAVNTPGIRVQRGNTTGDSGANAGSVSLNGGDASIIEKIALIGGGAVDAEYNAILSRARVTIRDCFINNWQGDGIQIRAFAGAGGALEGNANNWEVSRCLIQNCRNGLFVDGNDANAGAATLVDAISNRQWGIFDSSFLGNTYSACHTSGNVAGPYKSDNANARNVFIGCYSESGQPPSSFVAPTLVLGGLHAAGVTGVSWLNADQGLGARGAFIVDDNLFVRGSGAEFGRQSGAAADLQIFLDNTNFHSFIYGRVWNGGGATTIGNLDFHYGFGINYNVANAGWLHRFMVNGAVIGTVSSTGLAVTGVGAFTGAVTGSNLSGTNTGDQTITLTGNVTGSGTGSFAATIAPNAVTYAKMQTVTAARLLGNPTGGVAVPSEISLSADLAFSGSALQVGAFTGDITKAAGSLATTIAANAVTFAKMQALSAGGKVVGSAVGNTAIAELTVGTGLTVATSTLRMANISAVTLLGNPTGGATTPSEITLAGGLAFSGTTLTAAGALTPTSVASTGAVTSSGATSGIGYATGAGGTVTQLTSRTTGVTLNKASGAITLFSTTTAAAQFDSFVVTNSAVAATDTVNVCVKTATGKYVVTVLAVGAGSFTVGVYTPAAVGSAEAPVLNFAVIKAVAA